MNKAFTLIELLIVVAILGVLATFVTFSFQGTQKSARDTRRKAELKQYQDALEIYASANDGFYPFRRGSAQHGHVLADTVCQDIQASVELPNCPDDPTQTEAVDRYRYQSNGSAPGGGPTATRFVIRASLERDDEWFIICSDGRSGEVDKTVLFDGSGSCPL